jgi:hypothetical protein
VAMTNARFLHPIQTDRKRCFDPCKTGYANEVLTSFLICLTMLDKWLNLIRLANSSSWCLPPF